MATTYQEIIDALKASILGSATADQKRLTIRGRTIESHSLAELTEALKYFTQLNLPAAAQRPAVASFRSPR